MKTTALIFIYLMVSLIITEPVCADQQAAAQRFQQFEARLDQPDGYRAVIDEFPRYLDSIPASLIKSNSAVHRELTSLLEKMAGLPMPLKGPDDFFILDRMGPVAAFIDSTGFIYERIIVLELLFEMYQKASGLYNEEYTNTWARFRNDEINATEAGQLSQYYSQNSLMAQKGKAVAYTLALANTENSLDRKTRLRAWRFLQDKADEFPPGAIVQQVGILNKMEELAAGEKDKEILDLARKTINFIKLQQKKYPDMVGMAEDQQLPKKNIGVLPHQQQK